MAQYHATRRTVMVNVAVRNTPRVDERPSSISSTGTCNGLGLARRQDDRRPDHTMMSAHAGMPWEIKIVGCGRSGVILIRHRQVAAEDETQGPHPTSTQPTPGMRLQASRPGYKPDGSSMNVSYHTFYSSSCAGDSLFELKVQPQSPLLCQEGAAKFSAVFIGCWLHYQGMSWQKKAGLWSCRFSAQFR